MTFLRRTLALSALALAAPSQRRPLSRRRETQGRHDLHRDRRHARNVAGDKADVVSITKPGAEIHNYQPTPRDILSVRDADLVLWNGLGLELCSSASSASSGTSPRRVLTQGVEPILIAEGPYAGKPNPHAWMSPTLALTYVDNIRDALVAQDPANADAYAANAGPLQGRDHGQRRAAARGARSASRGPPLARHQRRRVLLLSRARLRAAGALPLADQRGFARDTPAGAPCDRYGEGGEDPRRLFGEHVSPDPANQVARARPARATAASSTSIPSVPRAGPFRPISTSCA